MSGYFAGSGAVNNDHASVKGENVIGSSSINVNDMRLDRPLPLKRVSAFLEAFLVKNKSALTAIHKTLRETFQQKRPGEDDRKHGNVKRFEHLWYWFLRAAEIHVTEPFWQTRGPQEDSACAPGSRTEFFHEPRHNDGSSSILHASLTLYGKRDVHFEQSAEIPVPTEPREFRTEQLDDFVVVNQPGTFYCGQVSRGTPDRLANPPKPPNELKTRMGRFPEKFVCVAKKRFPRRTCPPPDAAKTNAAFSPLPNPHG